MRRADNLTTLMCQLSRNSGNISFLESEGPVQDNLTFSLPMALEIPRSAFLIENGQEGENVELG